MHIQGILDTYTFPQKSSKNRMQLDFIIRCIFQRVCLCNRTCQHDKCHDCIFILKEYIVYIYNAMWCLHYQHMSSMHLWMIPVPRRDLLFLTLYLSFSFSFSLSIHPSPIFFFLLHFDPMNFGSTFWMHDQFQCKQSIPKIDIYFY